MLQMITKLKISWFTGFSKCAEIAILLFIQNLPRIELQEIKLRIRN